MTTRLARLLAGFTLAFSLSAAAADYPDRPIRLIVPYPPGGGADISSRIISQYLGEALGKAVIVDNRPGAGGNIGTEAVARAAPDGYTLLLASIATSVNASLFSSLPFNTKDFQPVSVFITVPLMMVVSPTFAPQSVGDLIALAKARPRQLNYASGGLGTANHIAGELFKYMANVDITHVPYKGGGPALNDVIGGQVQLYFGTITSVREQAKAGRVRALATTGATRASAAPELPTVAESGLPGFEVVAWYGVLAPAGTPQPIVDRLSTELSRIVRIPAVQEQIRAQGAEAVGSTPAEARRFLDAEIDKWAKVVKLSGMRAE